MPRVPCPPACHLHISMYLFFWTEASVVYAQGAARHSGCREAGAVPMQKGGGAPSMPQSEKAASRAAARGGSSSTVQSTASRGHGAPACASVCQRSLHGQGRGLFGQRPGIECGLVGLVMHAKWIRRVCYCSQHAVLNVRATSRRPDVPVTRSSRPRQSQPRGSRHGHDEHVRRCAQTSRAAGREGLGLARPGLALRTA